MTPSVKRCTGGYHFLTVFCYDVNINELKFAVDAKVFSFEKSKKFTITSI